MFYLGVFGCLCGRMCVHAWSPEEGGRSGAGSGGCERPAVGAGSPVSVVFLAQ